MSPLSPLIEFTEALLRVSCQASLVIGLVLLVQWLFQKQLSARWRYSLWTVVLLRLALPVLPGSPFSIFNYTQGVVLLARNGAAPGGTRPDLPGPAVTQSSAAQPDVLEARGTNDSRRNSVARNINPGARTAVSAQTNAGSQEAADRAVRAPSASRFALPTLPTCLAVLWLAGALLLAGRVISFPRRLNAQLAQHESPAPPALFEILEQSKRLIGVNRVLPIVQSRAVASPALLGFIRPWLLLPEGMAERFTPRELRLVFLHELAHLKRRDIAVNWLMTLLQVLHWFNPVVWFAFSRIRADRELACDELALSHAPEGDRQPYGQTMIKLLESFARPTAIASLVGILEDKQQMKRRIGMIAHFDRTAHWKILAPVLATVITLASLTDAQTTDTSDSAKNKSPSRSSSVALRRLPDFDGWLSDISADGRYGLGDVRIAETETKTVPFLVDLVTGVERRFDTAHERPGWPCAFRFSPDAKQILCARLWERRSNYTKELLLLDVESGNLRRIYRNEDIDTIWIQDWSSDGKTILATFERRDETRIRRKSIALISIVDGTAREIKTPDHFDLGNHSSCVFSPDMRAIAYDAWPLGGGTGDIRLISIDGSDDVPVVQHPATDLLVAWTSSPDQIVFLSDRRGGWDAYTLQIRNGRPVGEPVLLTELGKGAWPLRLTASGNLFFKKSTRNVDVFFADIDQISGKVLGKPKRAPHVEGRSHYPAWSPDGRFLAYVISSSQDGVIGIRDVESDAVRELNSITPKLCFPHWSNDGKSIYALSYSSGQSFVYRLSLDSVQPTVITKGVGIVYNDWPLWSWTPDGRSFYKKWSGDTFKRFDIETSNVEEFKIPGSGASSVFSPDCKQLVCSVTKKNPTGGGTRTISVVPLSGGEPRQLVELVGPEAIDAIYQRLSADEGLCWTPDGRYVLFVKGNPTDQKMRSLWRVGVAGGEAEDLGLEMQNLRQPTISPDGRRIAFTAGGTKNELWVMENFLPPQKTAAK